MTVDNRGGGDDEGGEMQRQSSKGESKEGSELISTPLEKVKRHLLIQNLNNKIFNSIFKLIHTKWMEAKIAFHDSPSNIVG